MNETLKKIGQELRRRYEDILRSPLNWRMIDAITHLEEIDEKKAEARAPRKSDEPRDRETAPDQETSSEREPQRRNGAVELPNRKLLA